MAAWRSTMEEGLQLLHLSQVQPACKIWGVTVRTMWMTWSWRRWRMAVELWVPYRRAWAWATQSYRGRRGLRATRCILWRGRWKGLLRRASGGSRARVIKSSMDGGDDDNQLYATTKNGKKDKNWMLMLLFSSSSYKAILRLKMFRSSMNESKFPSFDSLICWWFVKFWVEFFFVFPSIF